MMQKMTQTNAAFVSNRFKRAELTAHARKRSAQRTIGTDSVELIRAFGERSHDGRGGVRCLMTKTAVERLTRTVGHTQQIDALAGAYLVLSADDDSVVITVAYRHQ
jgi:hypothetical protein